MKSGLKAGELRHRLELVKDVETADSMGGSSTVEVFVANVWAGLKPELRPEKYEHMQLKGRVTHIVTTRFRKNLSSPVAMRFNFGDRVLSILGVVNPGEDGSRLLWMCEELQAKEST